MPIKIKDLSKELGVSSEDIMDQLCRLYVEVESADSKIDDKIAALVRIKLGVSSVGKKEPKKTKKASAKKTTKAKKTEEEKKEKTKKARKEKKEKTETTEKKEKKDKKKKAGETGSPEEVKPSEEAPVKKSGIQFVKKAEKKPEPAPEPEKTEKVSETDDDTGGSPEGKGAGKKFKKKTALEVIEKNQMGRRPKGRKGAKSRPAIEVIEKGASYIKGSKGWKKTRGRTPVVDTQISAPRKTPKKQQVQVPVSVRVLAPMINQKPNALIQYLMDKGAFVNINQDLEEDVVREIMAFFGFELEIPDTLESLEKDLVAEHYEEDKKDLVHRAPVVTFMGHVDHGKTSLLDYIRNTMVTKGEKGGITQHIGAYKVDSDHGSVTFLDTPGHAAFTAMRARGAHATDVVVLVVAADDGVMPQTKEAIDHAKAADVPIVVAINKCDLPGANPKRVEQELKNEGLISETWGGKTIMVEVSAITGEGVDHLVEMLMLESEMLELKANPGLKARGVVIETKKTPGQGVVSTLLVQNGTLHPGDVVLVGSFYGKVKAMLSDKRERTEEAFPSTPVEVLGLQGLPEAGEEFFVVKDEKKAKTLSELKQGQRRKQKMASNQRVTLEDLHSYIVEGQIKELKIVLKADVQGSAGALEQALHELSTDEVKVSIIHSAVGNINESDVMLAMVSNALVIGFHVKLDGQAEDLSKSESVDVHVYDIIYEAIADVKAGMEGLLEPEEKEVFQGRCQVREVFTSSKSGKVAGCVVQKGVIHRKDRVRVLRGAEVIHDGAINALRRFKDDVRDVKEGFEFGLSVKNFSDIRKNDIIEVYVIEKVARRLGA